MESLEIFLLVFLLFLCPLHQAIFMRKFAVNIRKLSLHCPYLITERQFDGKNLINCTATASKLKSWSTKRIFLSNEIASYTEPI